MTACNCRRDGMGVIPEWDCAKYTHRVGWTEEYQTRAEMTYAEDEFRWISNIMRSNGITHSKRQPA